MTSFTRIDLATSDIDWFAVDRCGHVGVFASNGSLSVPSRVIESQEDLAKALSYFEGLERQPEAFTVSPDLDRWTLWDEYEDGKKKYKDRYMAEVVEWPERGLFAFDFRGTRKHDGPYFLIAWPHKPILVSELPDDIRRYLSALVFDVAFEDLIERGLEVAGDKVTVVDRAP